MLSTGFVLATSIRHQLITAELGAFPLHALRLLRMVVASLDEKIGEMQVRCQLG